MMIHRMTQLAMSLIRVIDSCNHLTISEVRRMMRDGSILEQLQERLKPDFQITLLEPVEKLECVMALADFEKSVDLDRSYGLENNGLCVLLAYVMELIARTYAETLMERVEGGLGVVEAPLLGLEFDRRPSCGEENREGEDPAA